jgi:beta-glucosidase
MNPARQKAFAALWFSVFFSVTILAQPPQPLTAQAKQRIDAIVSKMTLEEKIDYIGGTGFAVRAMPALGLPALEMSDGPVGVRSNSGLPSTVYAGGIGLAATWNPELAARVGGGIGKDARARGIHFMLGPGVNIYRAPMNGRNFEYFGEDPFLSGAIATGYIQGMQEQGVSATVKHFLGNNSEYLRHDSDTEMDERTAREIYLPAFEAAVKHGHVGAIMDSYNLIDGQHATQNALFNTEIVRKEWGFTGVMMSDWVATYDGVAAANGGLDLEMPKGDLMNRETLLAAVKDGRVKEATLNEKVRRILETAARFGWLDRPQTNPSLSKFSTPDQEVALAAARESMVLLKNDSRVLPLDKNSVRSVLVVGPDAYPAAAVAGGSAKAIPFAPVSTLEGIGKYLGTSGTVFYDRGIPTLTDLARDTEFMTAPKNGERGITEEFFATNKELKGSPTSTTVVKHITEAGLGWDAFSDVGDAFAAFTTPKPSSRRWTGYYIATASGPYEIALQGGGEGGGLRLFVDDKLVIDNWKIWRALEPHVTVDLAAGPHKVVVEDYQNAALGGHLKLAIVDQRKLVSESAKALAAKADAVIIAAGFDAESESEGSDRTFGLPLGQDQLIREIAALNMKTVVTVISGGNVDSTSWIDRVPAYLELWYPGEAGGTALAEALFGQVNPSGRLPATFERRWEDNPTSATYYPEGDTKRIDYKEGIFVGYRGYEHKGVRPLFPFGYGLSYTAFKYANLTVAPASTSDALFTVSFDVTNTGDREGADVAQVYIADGHAKIERPAKELKGFQKTNLKPGETKHVSLPLGARSFAYFDPATKHWTIAPGNFEVLLGRSSQEIVLKGNVSVPESANSKL